MFDRLTLIHPCRRKNHPLANDPKTRNTIPSPGGEGKGEGER